MAFKNGLAGSPRLVGCCLFALELTARYASYPQYVVPVGDQPYKVLTPLSWCCNVESFPDRMGIKRRGRRF
jgi:hypothetical protein